MVEPSYLDVQTLPVRNPLSESLGLAANEARMVVDEEDIADDGVKGSLVHWVSWLMERHHAFLLPYIIGPLYPAPDPPLATPTVHLTPSAL
jgi:hypothetical protein